MSKIVLDDVTSLDAVSVLNSNFDKIEAELNDKVLYKNPPDGEPNALLKDLDINGKRLYNLPAPQASSEPVRKADLDAAVLGDYVVNSGVTSFNTRGGAVTLTNTDVFGALGYVPLITAVTGFRAGADSPRTGTVTLLGTDIATSLGYTPAPLASPTFSGTPTAPTATPGDNTTKVATTAFVTNAVTTATTGVITFNGRSGAVVPGSSDYTVAQISGAAPLASPVFTGSPTAPTQLSSDNSTKLATTAYVKSLVSGAGVSSFNTRTGAVTLTQADVTTALGFTPANVNSASLTGVPTAPTATYGTNTTQLATTSFVQAAVSGSVAGVASFKAWSGGTPRTGAITLVNTDVTNALHASATNRLVWNASEGNGAVDAGQATNLYVQRNANYGPGDTGGVSGAIYVHTFTPANAHNTYEWGITSEMFSYSTGHIDTVTPANGWGPQNVAINGTLWRRGSAPGWGSNFNCQNEFNYLGTALSGSNTLGCELDVGGFGVDSYKTTVGLQIAGGIANAPTWAAVTSYIKGRFVQPTTANGFYYVNLGTPGTSGGTQPSWPVIAGNVVVDGTITWTCIAKTVSLYTGAMVGGGFQYGYTVLSDGGTSASFYSEASAPYGFGVQLAGSYAVGIDTTLATNSSGIAFRMKAGDAIGFDGTSQYQMKLNASSGLLEFYNGSTRRGFINLGSGADVDLASGGGGATGVTSFNGLTGPVTYGSSDITGALGYTPASLSGTNTFTGSYNQFNNIVYATGGLNIGSSALTSNSSGNVTFSATAGATALPANVAFFHRIVVDGTTYKIPVYNA